MIYHCSMWEYPLKGFRADQSFKKESQCQAVLEGAKAQIRLQAASPSRRIAAPANPENGETLIAHLNSSR